MLDTLLDIGHVLRKSDEGLKHHRYVKPAPLPSKDNPVKFWKIPVRDDGSFDFKDREFLEGEAEFRGLFYLNYKTSDADSLKKYVMGDIYRTITKTGEDGNFRLGDPKSGAAAFRVNSFLRGDADAALFQSEHLSRFRRSFRAQMDEITGFLVAERNVYLHFDYQGRAWHKLPEMQVLDAQISTSFARNTDDGFVLKAFLYKTLGSGSSQAPGFGADGDKSFRTRAFKSTSELLDLVYAIDYSTRATLRTLDMKIIVLPRAKPGGEPLEAAQIERFFEPRKLEHQDSAESKLALELAYTVLEDDGTVLKPPTPEQAQNIAQFDFIFSKVSSSPSTPDADMIEVSGIDRSKLSHIAAHIRKMRLEIEAMRDRQMPVPKKPYRPLSVTGSLKNIVGDMTSAKKKYQSHLFQVLPQIYTDTYFRDPILLPALIEKSEFHLRSGNDYFPFLRYDFLFLTRIQTEGDKYLMDIQTSKSYSVGLLLGKLARPLRTKINSFDKNYAGLLSRRIGSKADLIALVKELNEKLIMHDCSAFTHPISYQISQELKDFPGRYDKDECAFGFFESYYAPIPKKEVAPAESTGDAS